MKQRTPEWFDARKGRVTGSIVGAILGTAPYMTREEALRSMVRDSHGAEREFTGNVATEYGTQMEPEAVAAFEMETGLDVKEVGFFPCEDWLGASPDGLCSDGFGLEIKCPYGIRNDPEPVFKTAAEQPHYYGQMQIEMLCAGWDAIWFWQWSPYGSSLECVKKDYKWLNENLPVLRQFHAEYLSELDNPEHLEPLRVELNTLESKRMVEEIAQLKEAQDNAKERQKELEAELIEMAGGKNANIWGHKLTRVDRKGNVQYAKVPELKGVDLEPYRGKGSTFWKLS